MQTQLHSGKGLKVCTSRVIRYNGRLMSKKSQIVDVHQIARRRGELTGQHDIADLPAVHDRLANRQGSVAFVLRPAYQSIDCAGGNKRLLIIELQLQASVNLTCQRTLQLFAYDLQSQSSVVLVSDDDTAAALPDEFEPMLADVRALDVLSLLAEELLLALPLAPVAPQTEPVTVTLTLADQTGSGADSNAVGNPFGVLGGLFSEQPAAESSGKYDAKNDSASGSRRSMNKQY